MKFYLDCEFHDKGNEIDLLSIAIVCEDGRLIHLAAIFDGNRVGDWLTENVLPHLQGLPRFPESVMRQRISSFMDTCLSGGKKAEFWGYYCAHDWFLLCRLFGGMMELPGRWGMYCREMMQLPNSEGFNCSDDIGEKNHSALFDAQWMRDKHAEVFGQPRIFGLW